MVAYRFSFVKPKSFHFCVNRPFWIYSEKVLHVESFYFHFPHSTAAKVKYRAFWYKSIKIGMNVGQWVYFKFKLGTHQYLYGNGRHFGFQNGRHI
jgi:hypothetical protein